MARRGDIYWADLNPVKGREQAGRRPVLVVSCDAINRQPLVITVVVGTDAAHLRRDYPTNIRLTAEETGLAKDTVFLCFQLRSLEPNRLQGLHGTSIPLAKLSGPRMQEVDAALRKTLGL